MELYKSMYKITTYNNQSVFDIALKVYGSIEGVFDLVKNNPGLRFDSLLGSGSILQAPGAVIKQEVVDYYAKNKINPATGNLPNLPAYIDEDMLKQILNYNLSGGDHVFPGIELKNLNLNASIQLNYTGINSADVQVKLEMSLDGVNFDEIPTSLVTLDNTKDSHTWIILGLITNYIRLKVIVNTATAGTLDEMLIKL